ncbi:DUF6113 family protein [Streptomyces boluensis]|uniref:Integral membrane protein n=1 Tax=Streptomyces boluensis TaxID=1775135 RepID=A0A964UPM4_9ACTN|nr:DUF6113 family protein [Streptomyces boluensis]NBE52482.1 hypothetical protein [Streptomyces boluensis]
MAQPLRPGRIALFVVLVAVGAVAGAAGALVQAAWFPGGLALALLAAAGVCYGGSRATGTRSGGFAAGVGWLVAVILLTTSRPEGDFVFGAGTGSYVYLLGGMAVAVMCATVAVPSQPVRPTGRLGK